MEILFKFEPQRDNTNDMTCALSEDSPSLIRVFAVRMKIHCVLSCQLSAQQRLWSDLSLRWAHSPFIGFVMSRLIYTCITCRAQSVTMTVLFSVFCLSSFGYEITDKATWHYVVAIKGIIRWAACLFYWLVLFVDKLICKNSQTDKKSSQVK